MDRLGSNRRHTIVVTGGFAPDPRALDRLPRIDCVVCADSGFDHARALGLDVDLLVGDLDSISDVGRAAAEALGVEILLAAPDKDLTDTELALAAGATRGATAITVLTGGGDRLDHVLGVMAALASDELADLELVDAWIGLDHLVIARPRRPIDLDLEPGSIVSLVPLDGPAHGVRTSGLRWPLHGETLRADRARGVSNQVVDGPLSVRLDAGVLAVIVPGRLERPLPKGDLS